MRMHRTPEQWASIKPDAFLTGSIQQARNIIEMMQQDIAALAGAHNVLRSAVWDAQNEWRGADPHSEFVPILESTKIELRK